MSIIGVDPLSPFYNTEINRIKVGAGPSDVAVQPEHEDVLINHLRRQLSGDELLEEGHRASQETTSPQSRPAASTLRHSRR